MSSLETVAFSCGYPQGMSVHEARRAAVLKVGSIDSAKERHRAERTLRLLTSPWSDLRFAPRSITREPRVTAVAVVLNALVGVLVRIRLSWVSPMTFA